MREAEDTLRAAVDARALLDELSGERARFVRMARSRVATNADAEDVVQRAMMRAAERSAQLEHAGRARAWFYRILRRAIIDHHRSAPREVGDEGLRDEPTAEDERPRAPACRCALRMIAQLRPAHAEVLRRVDVDGEEPAAVARAVGVSMTNLYVRLYRARRALRERVEKHCGVSSIAPCLECTCEAHGGCQD